MPLIEQYQVFELARDINPVITQGMMGTILKVVEPDKLFEVEFAKDDVNNYEFNGKSVFIVSLEDIIV